MNQIQYVSIDSIVFNKFEQMVIDENKVTEIAASIQQHRENGTKGLLQVPTARRLESGQYELAFGKHRFLAFKKNHEQDAAFFAEMPVIVRVLSDMEMFELMAIENFHRRDISAIEEARTFNAYMTTFEKTSVETAQKFEKTDEYVRSAVRLLNLPEEAQAKVTDGTITKSVARDLLVAEKLGGAHLVEMTLDELEGNDYEEASSTIKSYLTRSPFTTWLDKDEDWFKANKNFPRKHLPAITKEQLDEIVHYADGYGDGIPASLIKEIQTLISSGMEVVDEAFPQIRPDDLLRVRVLANPTPCEKCPLHAVLDGSHFCGLPLCRERKQDAWKKKVFDDIASQIGVPMYSKEDGPYQKLEYYIDVDKKLWEAGSPDLRLKEAKYQYTNFDGLNSHELCVVVIGETYEKRKASQDKKQAKEEANRDTESLARERAFAIRNATAQAIATFSWDVAARSLAVIFEGITSLPAMEMIADQIGSNPGWPDGVDEEEVRNIEGMKKADALKHLRRVAAHAALDFHIYNNDEFEVDLDDKKPLISHAKNIAKIAELWEVKLGKEFMEAAETAQQELDSAIKALTPEPAKRGKKQEAQ